jgi:hypothetical protein
MKGASEMEGCRCQHTCDNERIARGNANTRVPSYATQHESISNPYV